MHLGRALNATIPGWAALVDKLETVSQAPKPPEGATYPERLEQCLARMGREDFQRALRGSVFVPLADAIVQYLLQHPESVPDAATDLARLGVYANPIVNFNIEAFTSALIAGPGGPWTVLPFSPPIPGAVREIGAARGIHERSKYQRNIYHPHGVLDMSGICVMTASEYTSMRGTLALQLATHSAFASDLVIVGMSLDDQYLRNQISEFRDQIRHIIWYQDVEPDPVKVHWAWANRVSIVLAGSWPDFWSAARRNLEEPDEIAVRNTWESVVRGAFQALSNPILTKVDELMAEGYSRSELAKWSWFANIQGEDLDRPQEVTDSIDVGRALKPFRRATNRLRNGPPKRKIRPPKIDD